MTCERCRIDLAAHVGGQPHSRRVATHLKSCDACRAELAALECTTALLAQAPRHRPPADLWSRIERSLPTTPLPAPRRWTRRLAWCGGLAAAALVLALTWPRPSPHAAGLVDAGALLPLHQRLAGSAPWGAPALGDVLEAAAEGRR